VLRVAIDNPFTYRKSLVNITIPLFLGTPET